MHLRPLLLIMTTVPALLVLLVVASGIAGAGQTTVRETRLELGTHVGGRIESRLPTFLMSVEEIDTFNADLAPRRA